MSTSDNTGRAPDPPAIDHIAIAVSDLEDAVRLYREHFGAETSAPVTLPEQSIRVAYARFANVSIELMQPLQADSPVGRFLERNRRGGLHHVSIAVKDVSAAYEVAVAQGLGPIHPPRKGHHGRSLFFLNPKASHGTLIEIEEADPGPEPGTPQAGRS